MQDVERDFQGGDATEQRSAQIDDFLPIIMHKTSILLWFDVFFLEFAVRPPLFSALISCYSLREELVTVTF
jgi:hypothetical protein